LEITKPKTYIIKVCYQRNDFKIQNRSLLEEGYYIVMGTSEKKTIFVVDDEAIARDGVEEAIEGLYESVSFESAEELFRRLEKPIRNPDLILLDIDMPDMDGYETLEALKDKFKTKNIPMPPVIFLTGNDDVGSESKGLKLGAVDYIIKPFSTEILQQRIKTHLTIEDQKNELYILNNRLQEKVEAKTQTIVELKDAILKTMADLVEARDKFTGGHVERTQRYLGVLLDAMKEKDNYKKDLESWDIDLILQSAQLHDVGKIAIKDNILNKPGKLDKEEFEEMKTHTTYGEKVFEKIKESTSEHEFLEYAKVFAVTHHEKWDGTGYPNELKDYNIPLLGRLMAIADVYDAIVSKRPYKPARPHEDGVDVIKNGSGTQFDPALVDLFMSVSDKFKEISEENKGDSADDETPAKVETPKETEVERLRAKVEELTKEIEKKKAENKYVRGEIKKIAEKVCHISDSRGDGLNVRFYHVGVEGANIANKISSEFGDHVYWTPKEWGDEYPYDPNPYVGWYGNREYDDEVAHLSYGINKLLSLIERDLLLLLEWAYKNGLDHITDNDDVDYNKTGLNLYNAVLNYFSEDPAICNRVFVVNHYTEEEIHKGHWFVVHNYDMYPEEIAHGEPWYDEFDKEEYDYCFIPEGGDLDFPSSRGVYKDANGNNFLFYGVHCYNDLRFDCWPLIVVGDKGFRPGSYVNSDFWSDEYWKITVNGVERDKSIYIPKTCNLRGLSIHLMANAINKLYSKIDTLHSDIDTLNFEKERVENTAATIRGYMSHETNNFLNMILGPIEGFDLEENKDISPDAYGRILERIRKIKQNGENFSALMEDILAFGNEKPPIDEENYTLYDLITIVIDMTTTKIKNKVSPIKFVTDIDCNLPAVFLGDKKKIQQILINLLSNSIKYTRDGYVSLAVSEDRIDDYTTTVSIIVEDSGIGIDENDLTRIFEPYVRVDSHKNKDVKGTGLGLAITKNLVAVLGGKILVESEKEDESKGKRGWSRFTVTLPQKIVDSKPAASVENSGEKRVLVYFDQHNEDQRNEYAKSIIHALEGLNVSWDYASDESSFREKIKNENKPFSHVFAASALAKGAKEICKELDLSSRIVQFAMFGETVTNTGMAVLNLPAYSITIANVLNGKSNELMSRGYRETASFIAPDARILAVDDDDTNLNVIKDWLSRYEMNVDTCNSGKEAIEKVKVKTYDLIFMDHLMPEMDGIETAKRIIAQSKESGRELPIVALTASNDPVVKESFRQIGVNDFLHKPIDGILLDRSIAKLIIREKQRKRMGNRAKTVPINENRQDYYITIKGIDVNLGISNTPDGTLEKYLKKLGVFHKDWLGKFNKLKTAFETNDLKNYVIYVHGLKSSAAVIGATKLSENAKKLEAAGKRLKETDNPEDREFIKSHTPELIQLLESILDNIGNYLKEKAGGEAT